MKLFLITLAAALLHSQCQAKGIYPNFHQGSHGGYYNHGSYPRRHPIETGVHNRDFMSSGVHNPALNNVGLPNSQPDERERDTAPRNVIIYADEQPATRENGENILSSNPSDMMVEFDDGLNREDVAPISPEQRTQVSADRLDRLTSSFGALGSVSGHSSALPRVSTSSTGVSPLAYGHGVHGIHGYHHGGLSPFHHGLSSPHSYLNGFGSPYHNSHLNPYSTFPGHHKALGIHKPFAHTLSSPRYLGATGPLTPFHGSPRYAGVPKSPIAPLLGSPEYHGALPKPLSRFPAHLGSIAASSAFSNPYAAVRYSAGLNPYASGLGYLHSNTHVNPGYHYKAGLGKTPFLSAPWLH